MMRRSTSTAEDELLDEQPRGGRTLVGRMAGAPLDERHSRIPLLIVPNDDPNMTALAQRAHQAESELKRAEAEIDSLKTQRTMLAITAIGGPLLVWIAMRNRAAPPAPPPQQQAKT